LISLENSNGRWCSIACHATSSGIKHELGKQTPKNVNHIDSELGLGLLVVPRMIILSPS